jgi:hypothetical protein
MVLATPVLAITLALMSVERFWGVGIFDPKLGAIRFCFSTCSGSIAPGGLHHDSTRDGCDQ